MQWEIHAPVNNSFKNIYDVVQHLELRPIPALTLVVS